MRRTTGMATALLLMLLLVACTDEEPPPPPAAGDQEDEEEGPPPGVRVGVVLPPADTGAADEVDHEHLAFDEVAEGLGAEVAEVRAVVPDAGAFVGDVATLLVVEGYDVVCVFGRDARDVVDELAERHAAATFCAAPVEPDDEAPENVVLVDLALEELGHVVGVSLAALGGDDPVTLLGAGNRAGGEAFRSGLRAGVGATPLQEARGEVDELAAELEAAQDEEVAAIAVDAGGDARELVEGIEGVPVLAPLPLLDEGALRWQVRWDVVLSRVLDFYLEGDEEPPGRLGMRHDVFELHHGPQATRGMVARLEAAMGELERGERDPMAPGEEDADAAAEQDATNVPQAP